jgi:hypothetical protein
MDLWSRRLIVIAALVAGCIGRTLAQVPPPNLDPNTMNSGGGWRPSSATPPTGATPADGGTLQTVSASPRTSIARVSSGSGSLPNDAGQVWREYDITPYTLRVTSTNRPEQAIVDWILRETGYDAWHGDPVGLLSANGRTLRVYHTPQMQDAVSEIVDRFVNTQAETQGFSLQVVSVGSPSWRAKMQHVLRPVPVQSQGVQAWLLSKEDASMMLAELRKRSDFRTHSSPQLLIQNGQSTVVSATRPKNYIKDIVMKPEIWPGFEPQMAQIDEGFSIEFKPLLSLDSRSIDAVVKCNIDQVEKLTQVMLDVPTPAAPRQRTEVQVPQIDSSHFAEKFHWPTDMVLVIGFGIVPVPTPVESNSTMKIPLISPGDHADLLVLIENKGPVGAPKAPAVTRAPIPGTATR